MTFSRKLLSIFCMIGSCLQASQVPVSKDFLRDFRAKHTASSSLHDMLTDFAVHHMQQGNPEDLMKAEQFLKAATIISEQKMENAASIGQAYIILGLFYNEQLHQYDKALAALEKSLPFYKNDLPMQIELLETMISLASEHHDKKRVESYKKRVQQLRDDYDYMMQ